MLAEPIKRILAGAVAGSGRQFGSGGAIGGVADGLQDVMAKSRIFLYGAGAMCIALFIVYLVLIVLHHQDTTKLAAFSSVFGISIAGLIATMMRMARSQVQSGILLALVSGLPQDDVLPALKAVLTNAKETGAKRGEG